MCTSTRPGPQNGAPADEPGDHALGRSRGGLTTKIHLAADGRCRPLHFVLTPGQAGDALAFGQGMAAILVPRPVGRPRVRPEAALADKAYPSRAIRDHLRRRGIKAVIPIPADQQAHRRRRGSYGGRPPAFDREAYKQRNTVERCINRLKQWRGITTRYDKTATVYLAGSFLWSAH
ncbi:IS5 family transposase [Streptomyces hiroshimensis]|uniref:IS5 family transposase n=1 Tax=Streptomyces hiroshimensis TaxID=66424 RepID=A0ABQ2Y891_9ACTN|nr:IS5 family transposase [Streptomyces hiroshimensis]